MQLEPDTKKWAGSKLGKEYDKAVYCHPAYLTYMQSTSWRGTKKPLDEGERGEWKNCLETQHYKN